jgi:regulator of sigma D
MLTTLEQTKHALAGKHHAIDEWLAHREALLVTYMQLAGLSPQRQHARITATAIELQHFCQQLVDYVSAGHFDIYPHVVMAFEQASGDQIKATTEFALTFNDTYGHPNPSALDQLSDDLNQLGLMLEHRFSQEDRLIKALQVVESLTAQAG